MFVVPTEWMRPCLAWVFVLLCLFPIGVVGETAHVVSSSELQIEAAKVSQDRQQNIAKVRNFVSSPAGSDALMKARVDPQKVQAAVAELNDQEIAQLAARADKAQQDFAAGYLTTRDIALIILGVALLILIIVVVR